MIGIIYDKKFLCFCNVINNFKKIGSVLIIGLVVSVYIGYRNIGKKLYRCNTINCSIQKTIARVRI